MNVVSRKPEAATSEPREYFHMGATIMMILLILAFIGTTIYLGISVYLQG